MVVKHHLLSNIYARGSHRNDTIPYLLAAPLRAVRVGFNPGQLTHASAEEDPADNTVDVSVGVSPAGQQPFRRALPGLASDGSW